MGLLIRKTNWLSSKIKFKLQDWYEPWTSSLSTAYYVPIGELKATAMSLFCQWQALIHLMASNHCPSVLQKA